MLSCRVTLGRLACSQVADVHQHRVEHMPNARLDIASGRLKSMIYPGLRRRTPYLLNELHWPAGGSLGRLLTGVALMQSETLPYTRLTRDRRL